MTVSAMERPNILLVHMEDMGVQIPAYGDHTVATPNIDKLAKSAEPSGPRKFSSVGCQASFNSQADHHGKVLLLGEQLFSILRGETTAIDDDAVLFF